MINPLFGQILGLDDSSNQQPFNNPTTAHPDLTDKHLSKPDENGIRKFTDEGQQFLMGQINQPKLSDITQSAPQNQQNQQGMQSITSPMSPEQAGAALTAIGYPSAGGAVSGGLGALLGLL